MAKNIVLFIDGTWNRPFVGGFGKNTNVRKLFKAVAVSPSQKRLYLRGVGTERVFWQKTAGGISGWGTKLRIQRAYQFLSANYDEGDFVYLFGFSRGAFAARSLAGFVDAVGLLLKDKLNFVEQAYALYEKRPQHSQLELRSLLRRMTGAEKPNAEDRTQLPIYFIGVWDTVGALGLPGRMRKFSAPFTEYHQTDLPSNVTHARHALALHELRQPFEPLLWGGISAPQQTLDQVWFAGAHADVGGGYCEAEAMWSDEALHWMASEAADKGLQLMKNLLRGPSHDIKIHHEIKGVFLGLKPVVRTALAERNSLDRRTVETFGVHPSVYRRALRPEVRNYHFFRSGVNQRLKEIDRISLELIRELQFKHPQSIRDSDVVKEFITASGKPSNEQIDAFARSFCVQVICNDKESVASFQQEVSEISTKLISHVSGSKTPEDCGPWAERLEAIIEGVEHAKLLLPSEWQEKGTEVAEMIRAFKTDLAQLGIYGLPHQLKVGHALNVLSRSQISRRNS